MGVPATGVELAKVLAIPEDIEWLTASETIQKAENTSILLQKMHGCAFMAEIAITPSPDGKDCRILWINSAKSLENANQSLKIIFENAPQALLVCHPVTSKIMRINHAASKMFGMDLEDRTQWGSFDDLVKPTTRKAVFHKVHNENTIDESRIMVFDRHQSKIPVSLSARKLDIGGGQCILIGLTTGLGKIAEGTAQLKKEFVASEAAEPILNATPVPLIAATLENGKIARLNVAASRLLKVNPQDVEAGKDTLNSFIAASQIRPLLDQIKLQGELAEQQITITPKAGDNFTCYASARRAQVDGREFAVIGLSDTPPPDTTGYEDFFDQAPLPMLLIDKTDKAWIKRLNRRAHELFIAGDDSDLEQLRLKDILGLRTYAQFRKILEKSGFSDDFETDLNTAYGEEIACLLSGHTVLVNGEELFLVSINDITERKESALTLERFFNAAPLPMILSTLETGKVRRINRRASELFATPVDVERATLSLKDFFGQEETDAFFQKIKNGGFVDDFEVIIETPYGEKIWGLLSGQLINIEGEDCIMTGINDITERKNVEEALKQSREEALEATRQKSTFLSTMSHEIRTPMTGVLGMLELLHMTKLDEEQNSAVSVVKDSATALLTIIDDILDFSKIEAGRLQLETIAFDIREVVEGAVELMGARARGKGLELLCHVDESVPQGVLGDPTRLRQILLNLIGNAVKFTSNGAIVVRVLSILNKGDTAFVRFEIQDDGIGISKEKLRLLFKPFSQTDASTSRHFGGTGLGLSICKALTELMKGQISVTSEAGEGATFWFELGLEKTEVDTQTDKNALEGVHALILQSHEDTLLTYTQILEQQGAIVCGAKSLEDAQNKCMQGTPDVAIIDHSHEGFDGFAAIRKLQADTKLASESIILTSSDYADNVMQEARELGLGGRIFKPVRSTALIRQACLAAGRESTIQAHNEIKPRPQMDREDAIAENKMVLFAEDNPTNQMVIGKQLSRLGYAYDIAENGVVALEKLSQVDYALLLTDCRMPEMNGLELSLTIRKQEIDDKAEKRLPIVALTANATAEDADACLSAGMDDYLVKPLKFEKLGEAMQKWLPLDPIETMDAEIIEESEPVTTDETAVASDTPPVDLEQLGEILGMDDMEMFGDILNFFVETMDELLVDLEGSIAANDVEAISDHAHAAKGASRNAAAKDLGDELEYLEKNATSMNPDDIKSTHQNIVKNFGVVKEYVAQLGN
ncbi:response regulator [Terasakiella sp. A23]|uniref:response regulator n=1 Tax=Terasakiella sp. FCG-A23 TaxID=3080561 RepID=UPI0029543425|nr:response regulator [Terasakiella sp. A23]MDV7338616.1 response regulator [Terasakiella sp. A23]